MYMEKTRDMRKGAWTYEEDKLLKACINKYGVGKWHLVPGRAGLNRCRKSCRLRWLNYLNPKINRRTFAEDEVDMILRLHKLLGNRWSLIAARLPGRTANDVKNYWHTHLGKKVDSNKEEKEKPKETMKTHHEVIKPQPRTLFKNKPQPRTFSSNISPWPTGKHNFASDCGDRQNCATPTPLTTSNEDVNVQKERDIKTTMLPTGGNGDGGGDEENCTAQPFHGSAPVLSAMWWENLWNMEDQIGNEKIGTQSLVREQEENSILEFSKDLFSTEGLIDSDCYLDFNLCVVDSLWDL